MSEERKLAAIMFTDIVGYSLLMSEDEERAFQLLRKNRKIQKPAIEKHGGKWLKEIGDGVLASFPTISEAVYCAKEIQEHCRHDPDLKLRIGIHLGEVIFENDDVFGDGVNIASRLEPLAPVGGIYISESVFRNIQNKKGIEANYIGERSLRNIKDPIRIYEVIVEKSKNKADSGKDKGPQNDKMKRSKVLYMLLGILIIIVAVFLIWKFLPKKSTAELDKSIAILPLEYLSEDPDKQYLADGVLDAITGHLSKIRGLRVTPRTSIEQYRETTKTASIIGKELDVSYLIEGSFLMVDDQVMLTIQLIIAKDEDHVFFKEYNRDYIDIIAVQSEVAQTIAKEIEVIITPIEKDLIEKIPTENPTAYDLYLKARSEDDIEKAIILYNLVLDFDSTFALAYAGLAKCYREKHYWDTYFKEDFLDSSLILANIALSYDDQLDEGYLVKGRYYQSKGKFDEALQNFEKAVDINPNAANVWYTMSGLYARNSDFLNSLICLKNAYEIDFNEYQYLVIGRMARGLGHLGLFEESRAYCQKLLMLEADSKGNLDSLDYKITMLQVEHYYAYNDSLFSLFKLAYNKYPDNQYYLHHLGYQYMFHGDYEQAYIYIKRHKELMEERGRFELVRTHRLGYVAWQLGKYEEAQEYFNTQTYHCKESIRLKRPYGIRDAYYDLAGIYAFKGEKELAYDNLDKFASDDFYPIWFINLIKNDPMFDALRDEPRFQQIIHVMESKNRKDREKVKAWVAENSML